MKIVCSPRPIPAGVGAGRQPEHTGGCWCFPGSAFEFGILPSPSQEGRPPALGTCIVSWARAGAKAPECQFEKDTSLSDGACNSIHPTVSDAGDPGPERQHSRLWPTEAFPTGSHRQGKRAGEAGL